MKRRLRSWLWVSLLLVCAVAPLVPAFGEDFKAGVGRAEITPGEPLMLGGYAARTEAFKTVGQRLFAKALALQDTNGQVTLLVTADTIGTPRWFNDRLAERVGSELKIPRERFLFACSHSHSTPAVYGALDNCYHMTPALIAAERRYTEEFLERAFAAARASLTNLEPVKLWVGFGEAHFARNRRQVSGGTVFGMSTADIVDREVPVVRVDKVDGTVKALVFAYACHCTTLGASAEVSGDWAGYAQEHLEAAYPDAAALFITGCGADANPHPRGNTGLARQHGLALSGAVARVLNEPMTPVHGPIRAAFARVDLPHGPLPKKEYYESNLTNSVAGYVRHARQFLGKLERGEPIAASYPCPVQVWRFGEDFTLVGLGGEVVVDYSYRLRRELSGQRVYIAGYCNDVFGYVPSVRILNEGGYEADSNLIYYGLPTRFAPETEDLLVRQVIALVNQCR